MTLLETHGLTAFYGDFQALFGIDMEVAEGETIAIIGANGAGKTTFLRSLTGLLRNAHDAVRFDGRPIGDARANAVVALGIAMVPEGRKLFPSLSVEENLLIGGHAGRKGPWDLGRIFALFPVLQERRGAPATALSGGQQQMVSIGRALMSNPRLLLCDEISLGLAPTIIRDIYDSLPQVTDTGCTLMVVEQDINQAMAVADRIYCFQEGRITLEGRPAGLTRDRIRQAYFGV
ncbi:MAG: ABC transporter ATP-binding protein [Sneathiellaceae bacterium]